jgi:hypothetical protein
MDNSYAAIIVSTHTEKLLTEQADPRGLPAAEREAHARFFASQRLPQQQLAKVVANLPGGSVAVAPEISE